MRFPHPALFALLLLLLSRPVRADVLTLRDAIRSALKQNRSLLAAEEAVNQARANARKAWTYLGPSISLQAAQSWNNEVTAQFPFNDPRRPALITPVNQNGRCTPPADQPQSGAPVTTPPPVIPITAGPVCVFSQPSMQDIVVRPARSRSYTLQGMQPIFTGQALPAIQAAYAAVALAEANLAHAQEQIAYNVASLYFNAVLAARHVELSERSYQNILEHVTKAKARYDVGQIPRMGLLQAQIEATRTQANLTRARNDHRNALAALANLIGAHEVVALQSPEELTTAVQPALPEGDPAAIAYAHRSDLVAATEQVDMAYDGKNVTWMKFTPAIVVNGQYQHVSDPGAFGEKNSWTVMAVASLPLLQSGARIFELQESYSKIRQAEAMLAAKRDEVRLDVQTARSKLEVSRENYLVARKQAELAAENYAITKVSFENGMATSLDVIDANQALFAAELNALRESFNVSIDTLNYLRALGLLNETLDKL